MDKTNLNNKLICVQYPGIVNDIDYMMRTLGGVNHVSQTFCNDKQRLVLKFRPMNVYSKPIFGDLKPSSGILLKVKIRKSKNKNSNECPVIQETEIVGAIERVYEFSSLCDFQYLPIMTNKVTNEPECVYKKIVPTGFLQPEWLTENNDNQYFLPPIIFSRVDSLFPSLFRKEQPTTGQEVDDGLVGKTRLRRHKNTKYQPFNLTDQFPEEPNPHTAYFLKLKFVTNEDIEKVKEFFEKRPIASKMVIAWETQISSEKLKFILPNLAYYFVSGPWRIMWVRFGYDPRKHFESRYYQQLDFRISINLKEFVALRRHHSIAKPDHIRCPDGQKKNDKVYCPYFRDGRLPPCRQCIYQYCDIEVPQIQEMLDKLPTPRTGATCNEKSGWLPGGFDEQCREILLKMVNALVRNKDNEIEEETQGDMDIDLDENEEAYTEYDDQMQPDFSDNEGVFDE